MKALSHNCCQNVFAHEFCTNVVQIELNIFRNKVQTCLLLFFCATYEPAGTSATSV